MQNKDLIFVIIPTYRHDYRINDLTDLIHSLSVTSNIKYIEEILIVDNGNSLSEDGLVLKFETYPKVKCISEPQIGLNHARNTGIINSKANIVAFLDDDVVVSKYWAESILRGHNDPGMLCVGGPVLIRDEKTKEYPIWFSDYFLRFLLPPDFPGQAGILKAPYYLIGANMSFKKEAFKKFGLFDTDLDRKGKNLLSNGDTEFIIRISQDQIWYEPQAIVYGNIKKERLSRRFMVRRLLWQGISDYIMVNKVGLDNFYDKKEVYFTTVFFNKLVSRIISFRFFEAFCMFVRLFGYKFGWIYAKRGR